MKLATYLSAIDDAEHVAVVADDVLHGLPGPASMIELLAGCRAAAEEASRTAYCDPFELVPIGSAQLRVPVPRPPYVRDFMAFEEHAVTTAKGAGREVHPVWYLQPVFYFTNPAAVKGPRDPVEISPCSAAFGYELEVAVVIGRPGADIAGKNAADHIAGYVLLCDWSARDLQQREMAAGLGPVKGKDSATSFGPYLVTPDELDHRLDLQMTATVNGTPYSAGRLSSLYWSFAQMVSYASRGTELRTGDVLGSGTVGSGSILDLRYQHGRDRYPWLAAGDVVMLSAQGLGIIETTVRAVRSPAALLG